MAIRPLNSINGFSVGSNANVVVYANLDIVGNTITADSNFIGNGLTINGVSNLNTISNVKIFGGSSGQFISTDGSGNLIFSTAVGNSAAPMPYLIPTGESYIVNENFQGLFSQTITIDGEFEVDGVLIQVTDTVNASNNQVLYSDNGTPTGAAGFVFNSATSNLSIPGSLIASGNLLPNANVTYNLGSNTQRWNNLFLAGNTIYLGSGTIGTDANGDISLKSANGGQLVVAGNATFTSIENGNSNITITANGNVVTSVGGNLAVFVVTDTGANVYGTLSVTGNLTAGGIKTDNYYYSNGSPIPLGGTPGGSNTQIQFNNNGAFGASANLSFNTATNLLSVTGNVSADVVTGNYLISNSGCVTVGSGFIAVSGNAGGIFNSSITDINFGLVANVTIGSNTGNVTVRNNLNVASTLDAPNISVGDFYSRRTSIPVTINTVIDSFPIAQFRSAKYTIRAGDDAGYQALEVLLVHNNINSIITVYGSLSTINADLVTLTTGINGGNVELKATGTGANTTVNLMGTYVPD